MVFLAHGGALLLVLKGHSSVTSGFQAMVQTIAPFSLPIAALMVLSSGAGKVWEAVQAKVLCYQGAILFLSGLGFLGWAITILVNGIPEGNFSWSPGILTALMTYSTFVFTRFTIGAHSANRLDIRRATLIAVLVTLPIDLGVLVRLGVRIGHLFGA